MFRGVLQLLLQSDLIIKHFHAAPGYTTDNRHSCHVGVPDKRNNQIFFVESTPTWLI